jgi:hypothetical protein
MPRSNMPFARGPRRSPCRSNREAALLITLFLILAGAIGCDRQGKDETEPAASDRPPTETEVRETIERVLSEIYATDGASGAASAGVAFTFGSIQVAPKTEKQVEWGSPAREVYPVRVPVTVRASYRNYPGAPAWERTTERGVRSDDVFLFYKDPFSTWTFKTGKP